MRPVGCVRCALKKCYEQKVLSLNCSVLPRRGAQHQRRHVQREQRPADGGRSTYVRDQVAHASYRDRYVQRCQHYHVQRSKWKRISGHVSVMIRYSWSRVCNDSHQTIMCLCSLHQRQFQRSDLVAESALELIYPKSKRTADL